MCLAIPGKILSIDDSNGELVRTGKVSFGGIIKDVNLAYTPEAKVDDFVIVHVGFALNIIDEKEAMKVFEYLEEMDSEAIDAEQNPEQTKRKIEKSSKIE